MQTPSYVTPGQKMLEDIDLNKLTKKTFRRTEERLKAVSDQLVSGEDFRRQ